MKANFLRKANLDILGIGASLLCAVHCALLPLLLAILPLMGAIVLTNKKLEYGLMSISFLIGCAALGRGYFYRHRLIVPILLFIIGFVLLLAGHIFSAGAYLEPAFVAIGAIFITGSHLLNLQWSK